MHNWAGNVSYSTADLQHPTSVAQLSEIVTSASRVKALGSRHSFNDSADTVGTLVALDQLRLDGADTSEPQLDSTAGTVRVAAGVTHAQLGEFLQRHDYALHNLASLPHISVAGSIQTGTHGSGVRNSSLAADVRSFEIVRASGELESVSQGDENFHASVVGVGALGIVTAVTLRVEPSFQVSQHVHENMPWQAALANWAEIMAGGYSVSVFTTFDGPDTHQIWTKRRVDDASPTVDLVALGGREATQARHPVPGVNAAGVTAQRRNPGPWNERLAHFRSDFQPSFGEEIQSEYLMPAEHAVAAIEALRGIGHLISPLLFVCELRTVATDAAWLSPSYARASVAVHFTWHQRSEDLRALLPHVEAALAPFAARPHWGKVFTMPRAELRRVYPRLDEFTTETLRVDPNRRFGNSFLRRVLFD